MTPPRRQGLMGKGLAYEKNGSVYFRVSEHPKYGSLACLDVSGMEVKSGEVVAHGSVTGS